MLSRLSLRLFSFSSILVYSSCPAWAVLLLSLPGLWSVPLSSDLLDSSQCISSSVVLSRSDWFFYIFFTLSRCSHCVHGPPAPPTSRTSAGFSPRPPAVVITAYEQRLPGLRAGPLGTFVRDHLEHQWGRTADPGADRAHPAPLAPEQGAPRDTLPSTGLALLSTA